MSSSCGRAIALLAFIATGCEALPTEPLPPLSDLPPGLAAMSFTATGNATARYFMLELRSAAFDGFVAVNGNGEPVWTFPTTGSPFGFTVRANGNFVLHDSGRGLVEVRPDGKVVRELTRESAGTDIHHDVTVTPQNTVLFISTDVQSPNGTAITGEAIREWLPESGTVVKRWTSFDALDPDVDRSTRSTDDDWLHANSIALGSRGNILLSLHFLDQVISIAPGFDGIEWRLGGVNADIVVDDPFSGQHTAQEVAGGNILVFDNGFDRAEPYSRAVEYDPSGRLVWEWRPERGNWARVISGARRLPNGNTVVAFGTPADSPPGSTGPIEVYEVTRAGEVVWHLEVGGDVRSMYRATPLTGIGRR